MAFAHVLNFHVPTIFCILWYISCCKWPNYAFNFIFSCINLWGSIVGSTQSMDKGRGSLSLCGPCCHLDCIGIATTTQVGGCHSVPRPLCSSCLPTKGYGGCYRLPPTCTYKLVRKAFNPTRCGWWQGTQRRDCQLLPTPFV